MGVTRWVGRGGYYPAWRGSWDFGGASAATVRRGETEARRAGWGQRRCAGRGRARAPASKSCVRLVAEGSARGKERHEPFSGLGGYVTRSFFFFRQFCLARLRITRTNDRTNKKTLTHTDNHPSITTVRTTKVCYKKKIIIMQKISHICLLGLSRTLHLSTSRRPLRHTRAFSLHIFSFFFKL